MKSKVKKLLALVCCLALGVSSLAIATLPAAAEGEYFTITENNRNLFVNVGQEIALEDIAVSINGVSLSGKDVIWSSSDAAARIGGGILIVDAKGMYTLDVEDAEGNVGTVTVVAKNPEETEYVLYENDFNSVANGTLPEGWSIFKNADVTADEAAQAAIPTYVAEPQVKDGVLYVGNGAANLYTYVWLPEFLDSFGDYEVVADMAQTYAFNNTRFGGFILRGDRSETTAAHPVSGYRFHARRASTGSNGLWITNTVKIDNAGCSVGGPAPFYFGSVRGDWSKPDWTVEQPDDPWQQGQINPMFKPASPEGDAWKQHGYAITYKYGAFGDNLTLDVYKSYQQDQFAGDMGPGGGGGFYDTYFLDGDPALEGYELSGNTEAWIPEYKRETGAVGVWACGMQLAVDSIKVVVPAAKLPANPDYYEKSELDPALAEYQSQKIGVLSDIHLQTGATAADYALKEALSSLKAQGVSAILFTGDLVNTGVPAEYEKFISIWDSVFTDPATAPKRLTITGNHEFEGVYFRGETYDQVLQTYLDAFGYAEANFHEEINGIHVIGINSENHVVDGKYTLETTAWLEEQLEAAKADDPYAPIIVMCHQTLANTTYGSEWGSSATGSLYELLRYYPQVVYLAGHSHFDFTNERSIMQKDFTTIDVPSMQYTSVENGTGGSSAACYVNQNYLILEIDGTAKTMAVKRMKSYDKEDGSHTYETVQVKDAWSLSLPLSKKSFTYTSARADSAVAPTFAADAKVEVSNITSSSLSVLFPAASHDDYVHAYNVVVKDTAGEVLLSKYVVSDFYLLSGQATEYAMDLEGLPSNTKIVVEITALDSYKKESTPISAEAATTPITTPSVGHNVADFLDVNTAVGFEDSSPYRRDYELYVKSHPIKLIYDEELGRQVAYMGGWVNYPVSQGNLKEITDSFTVELTFKSPADPITAGQCLFGNPESGGLTVEYTGAGVFQVGAHIGGGYKYIQIPDLELDTWYHLIYTFDGEKSIAYINGEKAGEVESVGTVKYNSAVNYMAIGANVNAQGNAAYVFYGHIANARVYTKAMTAAEAAAATQAVVDDNFINALYQKWLALYNVKASVTGAEDLAAVDALMAEIDAALAGDLTEAVANEYIDKANALLIVLMKYDAKAPLTLMEDKLDDFTKVHASDAYAGLQWENNTEIKKTLVSKQNNDAPYALIYKLPGNVSEIQLDALGITVYDKCYLPEDFSFFVSADGENWVPVEATYSEPVDNAITSYWEEMTFTAPVDGEYTYVKVQMNQFGKAIDEAGAVTDRVNWSAVMDGVRIYYAEEGLEIPELPEDPEDPEDPENPDKPADPENPDVPGDTDSMGENVTATVVAMILMVLAAAAAFVTAKKRA